MTTDFWVKMGEIGRLTFISRLGIPIVDYRNSNFNWFMCDDLASLYRVKSGELWSSNSRVS